MKHNPYSTKRTKYVKCACGCKQVFDKYNWKNEPRKYISGHFQKNHSINEKGQFMPVPKITVNCYICNTSLKRTPSDVGRRKTFYCDLHKGADRDKKGYFIKGPTKEMVENAKKANEGRSLKHLKKHQFKKGFKPWNFDMGLTPIQRKIRVITSYKEWRQAVWERDNYTCQLCGIRGGKLNADHYPKSFASLVIENNIKNIGEAIACDALWDLGNGRTLCIDCHKGTASWGSQAFAVRRSA